MSQVCPCRSWTSWCTKFKANSDEKEYEKQDELKCSAMRAELANLFESIQKDSGDSLDNKMEEE